MSPFFMRQPYKLSFARSTLELGVRTAIMGILNVTPDSFSDGGQYFEHEKAIVRGKQIEQEGADIIDIGGETSRPGSHAVPEGEEIRRVIPVIEALAPLLTIPVSVDTYRARVAERAIQAGAQIVHDISAFRFDDNMPRIVSRMGAGMVLMHSRGNRETLHQQSRMNDPIRDVAESLSTSVERARAAGIAADAIVLDPGIGFGKTADESVAVLKS